MLQLHHLPVHLVLLSMQLLLLTAPVLAVLLITSLLFPQLNSVPTLLVTLHPLQSLRKEATMLLLRVERTSRRQSQSGLSSAAVPSVLPLKRIR